ncbi:hypothetical protein ACXR0O_09255 [Verrucomicrobiota bacterium sgz303538]
MKRRLAICALAVFAGYVLGTIRTFSRRRPIEAGDDSKPATFERSSGAPRADDPRESALGNALSELLQPSNDLQGLVAFGNAVEQLDSKQFEQILDRLEHDRTQRIDDRPAWLFKQWLKRDRAAAMAWLQPRLDALAQDGPLGFTFTWEARGSIVLAWAETDPQSAFDYAREHPQSGLATQLLWKVMGAWSARGDRARVALALDFPSGNARDTALHDLHQSWATDDPVAAFASAQTLPLGDVRSQVINDVLIEWGKRDAAAAFSQYKALGLDDSALLSKLLASSAAQNPMPALGWLQQLDDSQFGRCAPEVVESWARRDPAAALGWALANGVRISLQSDLITELKHDGFFGRTTTSSTKSVSPLAEAFKSKPAETLAWLHSLPAGGERDRVLELAIPASPDLERALKLFEMLSPDAAARAAGKMGFRFVDAPERAKDWTLSLPAGPVREAALQTLGIFVTGLELPPGPERDAYLSGSVHRSTLNGTAQTPTEKLQIIEKIGNPVLRRDVLNETMEEYVTLKWSSKEAAKALDAANFPEEWKRRWREAMAKLK